MRGLHRLAALAATTLILLLAPPPTMGNLPPQLEERTEFGQVCDPDAYGTGSVTDVPALPQQFSVHVEANIINENRITWVHEFFDEVNNRGAFNFFNEGMRERFIYDYDDNEIFVFPDVTRDKECSVYPLVESRFINFTFGLTRVNGSVHIGTARQFFEFLTDDTPINYVGPNSTVRGVPALQWDACINNDNVSMIASYFYNTDDWSYPTVADPSGSDLILSQIVVRGVSNFNNSVSNFYHVYSVFGFHSGPDSVPDRVFRVPTGLACSGRITGKPLPEAPSFFSTYTERIDNSRNQINVIREFYDSVHQLFRIDTYYDGQMGGEAGPVRIIQDFESNVVYSINQHTGNCTATSLADSLFQFDVSQDDDGNPQLVSPGRLLYLDSNFSYEGVTTVRGLEVDAYITVRDFFAFNPFVNLTDFVYELFFTRPGYSLNTDISSGPQVSVPWAYNMRGVASYPNYSDPTNMSTVDFDIAGSLFDFSAEEPPYDAFDASLCFSAEDTHTVVLLFETPRVGVDFRVFRTNLRASLVENLSIRPLQVNDIHIVIDNGSHIFVAFHLTNISEFASPKDNDTSADDAASLLENAANFGEALPFMVDLGNGNMVSPVLLSRARGRNRNFNNNNDTMCDCPTLPPPPDTTPTQGTVATVATTKGTVNTPNPVTTLEPSSTVPEPGDSTTAGPVTPVTIPTDTLDTPATVAVRTPDTNTPDANTTPDKTTVTKPSTKPSTTTAADPCENNITSRLGLSDGIVAAIGIGLFFVGFFAALITILACYICCRCLKGGDTREVSSVKYKKHDNELETF